MVDRRIPGVRGFLRDDRGAVTVDWVVLASLIVGLSIAIAGIYRDQLASLASDMSVEIAGVEMTTTLE
jgi:Flp pilus assembly pilin Flp